VQWDEAQWVQLGMIGTDSGTAQVGEVLRGVSEVMLTGSDYGRLNGT